MWVLCMCVRVCMFVCLSECVQCGHECISFSLDMCVVAGNDVCVCVCVVIHQHQICNRSPRDFRVISLMTSSIVTRDPNGQTVTNSCPLCRTDSLLSGQPGHFRRRFYLEGMGLGAALNQFGQSWFMVYHQKAEFAAINEHQKILCRLSTELLEDQKCKQ